MNELLKALYDHFYDPLPENELKKEIEDCHQQLIETLEKPERRLVNILAREGQLSAELEPPFRELRASVPLTESHLV